MAGQPGSGKSTLARAIAEHFGAVVVDKDILKSAVLFAGGEERVAAVAGYEAFFDLGHSLVAQGFSVILDSPSYSGGSRPDIPARGAEIAAIAGIPYCWIECVCNVEELSRRVDSRVRRPSQYETTKSLDMSLENHTPEGIEVIRVDSSGPIETYLGKATDYIYREFKHKTGEVLRLPGWGVFVAIFDEEDRLLMVKQNYGARLWSLPGGAIDAGETPLDALTREVREETGLWVEPEEIIGTYSRPFSDSHIILYRTRPVAGELIESNHEIAEVRYFAEGQLPLDRGPGARVWSKDAFTRKTGFLRAFDAETGEYE